MEHGAEVWDVDLSVVHITRLDGRAGRREAGVKQHRGILTEEQIWQRDGVSVVSPARSIVEVTTEQDVEHSLVVANSLLHLKRTSMDLVAAEAIRCDRWPDSLATASSWRSQSRGSRASGRRERTTSSGHNVSRSSSRST